MDYWEDFFSLDKIIYPIIASILMGLLYFLISYLLDINYLEWLFYASIGIGFLMGNLYKTNYIQLQKLKKKHKSKKNKIT